MEHQTLLSSIGQGELNFTIQTTGAQQGGIQRVRSVRSHDDLDRRSLVETVHLIQQLQQNSLHFSVSAGLGVETLEKTKLENCSFLIWK